MHEGYYDRHVKVEDLKGLIFAKVEGKVNDKVVTFVTEPSTDGSNLVRTFKMYHSQDCCEIVTLNDIAGDLSDLVGVTILEAYEESNSDPIEGQIAQSSIYDDSWTWTFYRFTTVKGTVVLRWLGTSNGYYSEGVSLYEVKP